MKGPLSPLAPICSFEADRGICSVSLFLNHSLVTAQCDIFMYVIIYKIRTTLENFTLEKICSSGGDAGGCHWYGRREVEKGKKGQVNT